LDGGQGRAKFKKKMKSKWETFKKSADVMGERFLFKKSWRWKWFSRRHMAEQQTGRWIFFNEDTRKKKFHFPLWSFVNIESLSAAAVAGQM
jgi:hypothetical protein